jgi:hypothetical protein
VTGERLISRTPDEAALTLVVVMLVDGALFDMVEHSG